MSSPTLYANPSAKSWTYSYETDISLARAFHKRLPGYEQTPLVPLHDLAAEMGFDAVFVKDESSRLGLPAFKILGASWGTFRAIADQTGLSLDASLRDVSEAAKKAGTILFAATEGNHGRAVARMGKILEIPTRVFLSRFANGETRRKIESEGAQVTVIQGSYDDAVAAAFAESARLSTGLLIQDNAFEGYERIPAWIVEGYSTLLFEIEEQLEARGLRATMVVTPIGVGSLGHAVVAYCKSGGRQIEVLTVEPETAACLHHNLSAGEWSTIDTSATIMNGMNCGTVSPISWPVLSKGVDASITVSDLECHESVQYLQSRGINAGPCGAATLAAIKKAGSTALISGDTPSNPVVVLLNTEGARAYPLPHSDLVSKASDRPGP
ncbi:Diaminopropionate ammonia-lyase [Cladophialophora carrionii]|uniref:Diaminopropionate ammonia-lyase n=1 Tax=Cladophialophora carrionii TaxID=86049 RepID=A0A1C1CGT5_9EURO|nr:Diaminopropionate ammonia-lyase [Cladophialophora carrionii]